eukprot:1175470-Prorocentrum_minimum.AAC.1
MSPCFSQSNHPPWRRVPPRTRTCGGMSLFSGRTIANFDPPPPPGPAPTPAAGLTPPSPGTRCATGARDPS